MLVIAGAGTGKTTVLTRASPIWSAKATPVPIEILALTYTENAAKEMRERVQAELRGTDVSGLRQSPFTPIATNCCKSNGREFERTRRPGSLDLSAQAHSRTGPELFRPRRQRQQVSR